MSATGRSGPHARELRAQIREWRRGRADTRLVDALGDAYVAVFATLMLGSMAANVVVNVRGVIGTSCAAGTCAQARALLPWVFALAVLTAALALARLLGPMLTSPGVSSWLLTTPVDRRALLRPRLAGTVGVAFLAGGLLTTAAATLAGFAPAVVVAFAVAVAGACCAAVALACVGQAADSGLPRAATWVLVSLVWLGLLLLDLGEVPAAGTSPAPGAAWAVAAAGLCMLGLLAVVRAAGSLARLRRDQLTPGGALAPALSGALASLDFALLYDLLLARHWRARSTVRPVRGRGSGLAALVWRDVVRLRRNPQSLLVLAGALVAPYLAGTLGLGRVVPLVAAGVGFLAALGLFSALRVTSRTPGLVRALPFEPWQVKAASLAVPGALLLAWGLATAPDLHLSTAGTTWPGAVLAALAVGLTAVTAVTRWMTGKPADYQLPLVTSPMGAVPTSLYASAARGLDVLLLLSTPLLIAPGTGGAEVSLLLGAVVLAVLLGRR